MDTGFSKWLFKTRIFNLLLMQWFSPDDAILTWGTGYNPPHDDLAAAAAGAPGGAGGPGGEQTLRTRTFIPSKDWKNVILCSKMKNGKRELMSSSWNLPSWAKPSWKGSKPSQVEVEHFNSWAETELTKFLGLFFWNKKPLYLCSAVYRLRQLDWSTVNSFLYRSVKLSAGSCSVLPCTFTHLKFQIVPRKSISKVGA